MADAEAGVVGVKETLANCVAGKEIAIDEIDEVTALAELARDADLDTAAR